MSKKSNTIAAIVVGAAVIITIIALLMSRKEKFGWAYSPVIPAPNGVDLRLKDPNVVSRDYELVGSSDLPVDTSNTGVVNTADLLPKMGASATIYDKDVTDPKTYIHRPAPRVILQGRLYAASDKYRGDIYINPNQPSPWARTVSDYNASDGYNDNAYFSEFGKMKYEMLTRGREFNIANEETIMS
uniref:Uncharacterized protein n=1 Tax=viral metagenome TaxID=1070528 RepID=A0A6C0LXV9_9ZZZZ